MTSKIQGKFKDNFNIHYKLIKNPSSKSHGTHY
jgi:hypothetical protein